MPKSRAFVVSLAAALLLMVPLAVPAAARGPRPANDNIGSAAAIGSLPFSATVDISRLTREPGDPGPFCVNGGNAWYRFMVPDRRMIRLSASGGTVPAAIELYADAGSGLQIRGCAFDFMSPGALFQVEPGIAYYVMIGPTDASATRGTVTLSVTTHGDPPTHDTKAGAVDLTPGTIFTSDSTGATVDGDDFAPCFARGATAWHRYVAPADGRLGASVNAGAFSPVLNIGVQTETGIQGLACINGSDSPMFFSIAAGSTYWLLVADSTGLEGGPYSVNLFDAPPIVPTVTIDGGTVDRAAGTATISGTVRCSQPAQFALGVIVTQRTATGSAFPAQPIGCALEPVSWSATVTADGVAFGPGPADVIAGGTAFTQFDSGSTNVGASIALKNQ